MSVISDIMLRCVAVEKEAMTAYDIEADSWPYFRHVQEDYPYFTHRLGTSTYSFDSESIQDRIVTVEIRMFVGHRTEGYAENTSEVENRLFSYIEIVRKAYACRTLGDLPAGAWLISDTYPTEAMFSDPITGNEYTIQEMGVALTSDSGYTEFSQSNIGTVQLGTRFNLEIPLMQRVGGIY